MRKLLQSSCSAEILPPCSPSLTQFSRPSVDLGITCQPPPRLDPSPLTAEAEDKGGMEGVGGLAALPVTKTMALLTPPNGLPSSPPITQDPVSWANSCHTA